jgi:hypothetical protein
MTLLVDLGVPGCFQGLSRAFSNGVDEEQTHGWRLAIKATEQEKISWCTVCYFGKEQAGRGQSAPMMDMLLIAALARLASSSRQWFLSNGAKSDAGNKKYYQVR